MKSHIFAWGLSLAIASTGLAQSPPVDDPEGVYRLHPRMDAIELIRIEPEEINPGFVYNYYHPEIERRVWGVATETGDFEYALGEGSTIPAYRFDLQISPQMQSLLFEAPVPSLEHVLQNVGRDPALRLNEAGDWRLLRSPSSARVYDLLTHRRWEWHGERRVAVLHTHGNQWQVVDGKYRPMFALMHGHEGMAYASTCL